MASSSLTTMEVRECRNWADLPPELMSAMLSRLVTVDILENVQKVCRSWRNVCKDPLMWRKIDMFNHRFFVGKKYDPEIMCRHVVDRSQGGLTEIDVWQFGTDELLNYIADRSNNLRYLGLQMCSPLLTESGLVSALRKLPFLEELEIAYPCENLDLKAIGYSCPLLKTFKLNRLSLNFIKYDDEALAIAETMPELRHLELFSNRLSNTGLKAVLDSCLHLEHLDLRLCFNMRLVGDLKNRCSKIKYLRY